LRRWVLKRIAVDVGGTFTDFTIQDELSGRLLIAKHLTTPEDPSIGVMEEIDRLAREREIDLKEVSQVVHGTTFPSNLIIERKGKNTFLITTKGFKDVLENARIKRYDLYDLFIDKPVPLVPRRSIHEVTERMAYDGTVLIPLNENEAREVIKELMSRGAESIAICLLHSYANPVHERMLKKIIEDEFPGIYVSLSSEISANYKEYERTSTTVANAYLMKGVTHYIKNLKEQFEKRGFVKNIYIMQSNGGIAASLTMERFPVHMVESGPAAGAQLSAFFGKTLNMENLLSFEMGGTTAKICPIVKGEPKITDEFEIEKIKLRSGSGLPINIPAIDMIEIGAGGGSIARVSMGLLVVGPDSAGAMPGPMCYAIGGQEPTVTDANVVLGYLNPDFFAGGEMKLDPVASEAGIRDKIARPLGYSVEQAAWGIYEIVTANMARATRVMTIERGYDPRNFVLMAFGGAGPMHGSRVARTVGIKRLIIPVFAGVASALGMLITDPKFHFSRTYIAKLDPIVMGRMKKIYQELEATGLENLNRCGASGTFRYIKSSDMRYFGQGHEINVPVLEEDFSKNGAERLKARFNEEYRRNYGYVDDGAELEVVTFKLTAVCLRPKFDLKAGTHKSKGVDPKKGERKIYIPEEKGFRSCPVYDREKLYQGFKATGPAIVEERTSSTVVFPGDVLEVDGLGNLEITLNEMEKRRK
jgi:N-methylhydantoinase A